MVVKKYLEFLVGILLLGQPSLAEMVTTFPQLFAKNQISLTDPNRKTVLIFVSSVCPCFKNGISDLKKQVKAYQESHYFVAVVGKKDSQTKYKKFYEKTGLGIPFIVDKQNQLAKRYQVEAVATAVVLAPDDKVLYRGGIINEDSTPLLATVLEHTKAGIETTVPFDKGVGCTIE